MSEWRGLHNPERHRSTPDPDRWGDDFQLRCVECSRWCYESAPCRCCLKAEVERLTAALADRETRGGSTDCSSSRPAEGSEVIQSPSDPSPFADEGQRIDVDYLLSQRMEQVPDPQPCDCDNCADMAMGDGDE